MIIPDEKEFIGKVAVIKQEGKVVRVLLHEGETLYSARDILSACGVKYPSKWCQRESKVPGRVELIKLSYSHCTTRSQPFWRTQRRRRYEAHWLQRGTKEYINGWMYGAVQTSCGQIRRLRENQMGEDKEGNEVRKGKGGGLCMS